MVSQPAEGAVPGGASPVPRKNIHPRASLPLEYPPREDPETPPSVPLLAHELNNLLGVICGYSDLILHRDDLDEELRTHLEEVRSAGVRAASIAQQLRAPGSRRQRLEPPPGDGAESQAFSAPLDAPAPAGAQRAPRPPPRPDDTPAILLVDDDDLVRGLILEVLRLQGYRVLTATDGPEALRVFEQQQGDVQLLVTDLVMPGMTGRELGEALLARAPNLKVLYTSGYTDDVVFREGLLDPATPFVRKPFRPDDMIRRVQELLA